MRTGGVTAALALLLAGCATSTGAQAPRQKIDPPRPAAPAARAQQAEAPRLARNCGYQLQIVKAATSSRPMEQWVAPALELAKLQRRLAALKTSHGEACRRETAELLRALATRMHQDANRTLREATFRGARRLYEAYLSGFPRAEDATAITFYLAEVLFKLEQWQAAGEAYREVVRRDPGGKHAKEAAYAAVIALKNAASNAPARGPSSKDHTKPRPIPRLQRELLAAGEAYLRLVPRAPERVPLLYRLARIYYEHAHHDEAIKRFARIITDHPDHELASYAANLLLDSLNILKRYEAMARWVERMLKLPRLAKGDLLRTLDQLWIGIARKRVEKLERAKKYRACGEGYLRIVARYPTHHWRDELLYNAAICFELAKLPRRAIAARVNLVTSTPGSRLVPRSLVMLAEGLQQQGDPGEAARYLEQLAHRFPAEREAPDALKRAFALRMARQEHRQARADAERFVLRYGARRRHVRDAARLAFALGEIHERGGDHAAAYKHYEGWLARWGREGGPELRLRGLVKRNEALWRGSCPVKEIDGTCARPARRPARTRGCGPGLLDPLRIVRRRRRQARRAQGLLAGVSRQAGAPAAWAAFFGVQPRFEAFLALGALPHARRDLTKALDARKAQLGQALEAYRRVIARGAPGPALAALARTAQLQLAFADQLLTTPVPPRAPRETYCEALDTHVDPLREAATRALRKCAGHKVGGPWPALCKRLLSRVGGATAGSRRTSSSGTTWTASGAKR